MANCLDDKVWDSFVPDNGAKEVGRFHITKDLGNGEFEGEFLIGRRIDIIKGHCTSNTICFDRPKDRPVFRYCGAFIFVNGEKTLIQGERLEHRDIFRKEKGSKERVGDDWTGERPTTFVTTTTDAEEAGKET